MIETSVPDVRDRSVWNIECACRRVGGVSDIGCNDVLSAVWRKEEV